MLNLPQYLTERARWLSAPAAALIYVFVTGCASTGDPNDPWEGMNRGVYAFNETVDDIVLKPAATAYKTVIPAPIDRAVTNFFENFADIVTAANNILQFKFLNAVEDGARVAFNSTIGLAGLIDVASGLGI